MKKEEEISRELDWVINEFKDRERDISRDEKG